MKLAQAGASGADKPIHRGIHDPTGSRQIVPVAQGLKQDTNAQFIDQIEHDCKVGAHLEWGIAAGTMALKSVGKGWVLGKASESLGVRAKLAGFATGGAIGAVTGIYTAYETAELLENSCRAKAFEERLRQTGSGSQTVDGPDFAPLTQTYEIERGWPSVRTVVDRSREALALATGHDPQEKHNNFSKSALAHGALDDNAYIDWAHKESSWSWERIAKRDAGFATVGATGGVFAAHKLHLGTPGKVVMGLGGAAFAVGLSHLGISADQDTRLAELLKARLLSKPNVRPNP